MKPWIRSGLWLAALAWAWMGIGPGGSARAAAGVITSAGSPVYRPLIPNGGSVPANIAAGGAEWFQFQATNSGNYVIDTRPGTLRDNRLALYGPGDASLKLAGDDDGGLNKMARLAVGLGPGTYFLKVWAAAPDSAGACQVSLTGGDRPAVASLQINNGGAFNNGRLVVLNNQCLGNPIEYQASEASNFTRAVWYKYSGQPLFRFAVGNGVKNLFFKVRNQAGAESDPLLRTVTIQEGATNRLVLDDPPLLAELSQPGGLVWHTFNANDTNTYVIETWPGTLLDNRMSLYGSRDPNRLLQSDDDSGQGDAALIATRLDPDRYYVGVEASIFGETGTYYIQVRRASGPRVLSLALNQGQEATTSRTVILNNSCTNNPTYFQASESADFNGLTWQPYSSAPSFLLSAGDGLKTVYFKVRDDQWLESPVVSARIRLAEAAPVDLVMDALPFEKTIVAGGDAHWYRFVAATNGAYVLEVQAGTLKDPILELYGPNSQSLMLDQSSGSPARIVRQLEPGEYFAKVYAYSAAATGSYKIQLTAGVTPVVIAFALNNGAASTFSRVVVLNNICWWQPVDYLASESTNFAGAVWHPYSVAPVFQLAPGDGPKTVYFKVRNGKGQESATKSSTIQLREVAMPDLLVNGDWADSAISPAGDEDWFRVSVAAPGLWSFETRMGTLAGTYLYLHGPNDSTLLVDQKASRLDVSLSPGVYYLKVVALTPGTVGSYSLRAVNQGPEVLSFQINGGQATADSRTVILNNSCSLSPSQYQASESVTFAGAAWQPYSTTPGFVLSSGNGAKTVYFKVQDLAGRESKPVNASINLQELKILALPVNGSFSVASIQVPAEEDWYSFVITAAGVYTVETRAGTLADTYLELRGPGDRNVILAADDNGGDGLAALLQTSLAAGTYYARVTAKAGQTGGYSIRVKPGAWTPEIADIRINSGAGATTSQGVAISTTCYGKPVEYLVSENSTFAGASWQPYATNIVLRLSSTEGTKYVYLKVRNASRLESPSRNATISLRLAITALNINAAPLAGQIDPVGDVDWYSIPVAAAGAYTLKATPGTLGGSTLRLYGPNNRTSLLVASPSPLATNLNPGTYYLAVEPLTFTNTGAYSAQAVSAPPQVLSFALNSGAYLTPFPVVYLNNACTNLAAWYLASESPDFAGTTWQAYASAPIFNLSADLGTKKVFFKVKDAANQESPVVSDTILLADPPQSITVNGGALYNEIDPARDEDWYYFDVQFSGIHNVEFLGGGTLSSVLISLYGPNNFLKPVVEKTPNKITWMLATGRYYFKVEPTTAGLTGSYMIWVYK
jgi:hypothetical protein